MAESDAGLPSVLAALQQRDRLGQGEYVDLSMASTTNGGRSDGHTEVYNTTSPSCFNCHRYGEISASPCWMRLAFCCSRRLRACRSSIS